MIGTRLAHYEITAHLGSGGMGDVYQATDSKLGRSVAIKLLPEAFTHDSDRAVRFEREARLLASMNHANIATIHGLEESSGRSFLVMELVEGETLAERIKRGPIPVAEALGFASQILEALEYAHDKNVIHRDLKPANVKITPEGKVKVLDFGLAKAFEPETTITTLSNSPTLTMGATQQGLILGTAAYMSPEQARGKAVDRRTDIFSFGAVLYEMLTGRAAFEGEDVAEILSRVLQREPDWTLLPPNTPLRIRDLLHFCLRKDQKKRRQTATDVRIDLEESLAEPVATIPGVVAPVSRSRERLLMAAAAALLIGMVALAFVHFRETPPTSPPETRTEINTPPTADPASLAISPDGQKIVFVATSEGRSQLWLRSLDSVSTRVMVGTDDASFPFWSPDNQSVGFFADGKLRRIDIIGGSVQTLASAPLARGGAWNRDGTILFAATSGSPIFRVPSSGGEPAMVTQLRVQQESHRFPQFLPDGHHFLYYVTGAAEARGVYIKDLSEVSAARRLFDADAAAVVGSSGQLFFVREDTLFEQDFDAVRLAPVGNPVPLAEQVAVDSALNVAALSVSAAGSIVYRTAPSVGRWFAWFDRMGKEIGKVGEPDIVESINPSLSPDGGYIALQRTVNGNQDIWRLETRRGVLSRFTFDAATEYGPLWSRDGSRIVFNSNRHGEYDLYQKSATGAGSEELLLTTPQTKTPLDWSPDGHFMLYRSLDPKTGWDLWVLPLDGDGRQFPVVRTNFEERDGQFSPDGKWIAYQSNESGRFEIYVHRFSGDEGQVSGTWQISTNGGAQVRWRPDGKELFYIALDGRLMAVPIQFTPKSDAVEVGLPNPLFLTHVGGAVQAKNLQQYMVSPDGQRFLMNTVSDQATSIFVILNWHPERGGK